MHVFQNITMSRKEQRLNNVLCSKLTNNATTRERETTGQVSLFRSNGALCPLVCV